MFAHGYDNMLQLEEWTFKLHNDLGFKVHSSKGCFDSTQVGDQLGMVLYYHLWEFRVPEKKLKSIAILAKSILCKAAANKRWVSVK